jgi:hypothetical protein
MAAPDPDDGPTADEPDASETSESAIEHEANAHEGEAQGEEGEEDESEADEEDEDQSDADADADAPEANNEPDEADEDPLDQPAPDEDETLDMAAPDPDPEDGPAADEPDASEPSETADQHDADADEQGEEDEEDESEEDEDQSDADADAPEANNEPDEADEDPLDQPAPDEDETLDMAAPDPEDGPAADEPDASETSETADEHDADEPDAKSASAAQTSPALEAELQSGAFASIARQVALQRWMAGRSWNVDLGAGTLIVGEGDDAEQTALHVLGSVSPDDTRFMWSWANARFPEAVVAMASSLRDDGVPEFAVDRLPIDSDRMVALLVAASARSGNATFFGRSRSGGPGVLLLVDVPLSIDEATLTATLDELTALLPRLSDPRATVTAGLEALGLTWADDDGAVEVTLDDASLRIAFDADGAPRYR